MYLVFSAHLQKPFLIVHIKMAVSEWFYFKNYQASPFVFNETINFTNNFLTIHPTDENS